MPRGSSSSSSSSSRSSAKAVAPPKQTTQAPQQSMAGGLMGTMMSGMAWGAGMEVMRGLFRSETFGPSMMPLFLSGLTTWGTRRFLIQNNPYKLHISLLVFGGTFYATNRTLNKNQGEGEERF